MARCPNHQAGEHGDQPHNHAITDGTAARAPEHNRGNPRPHQGAYGKRPERVRNLGEPQTTVGGPGQHRKHQYRNNVRHQRFHELILPTCMPPRATEIKYVTHPMIVINAKEIIR